MVSFADLNDYDFGKKEISGISLFNSGTIHISLALI